MTLVGDEEIGGSAQGVNVSCWPFMSAKELELDDRYLLRREAKWTGLGE